MKTIELTAVNIDAERAVILTEQRAGGQSGQVQLDDLENPISEENESTPTAGEAPALYFPVTINPADVREFYPRKGARVGTRIVFINGAARPVKETYAEVAAKFAALNN